MLGVAAAVGITGAASLALCEKTPAAAASAAAPSFDPEALERGAKALREINKSANAKQVNLKRENQTTTATTRRRRQRLRFFSTSSFFLNLLRQLQNNKTKQTKQNNRSSSLPGSRK